MKRNRKAKKKTVRPTYHYDVEHDYNGEIIDVCTNALLQIELKKLEQAVSKENAVKKILRAKVASRNLTPIASRYFERLLDLATKNPLRQVVVPVLNSTIEEAKTIHEHLSTFKEVAYKDRVDNFIESLVAKHEFKSVPSSDPYFMINGRNLAFDDEGNIKTTLVISIHNANNLKEKVVMLAYKQGLTAYISQEPAKFDVLLYRSNNTPGVQMIGL